MLDIMKVIHLENVDVSIWSFINYVNFATLGLNLELNIVKTQRNSTQLNPKQLLKQLRWVRHSTHLEPTHHPQTFQPLL